MNWPQIFASGVVAAVAAAIINGMTAWLRLRAEAKERRATSRDDHLRTAVVDLLAAEARWFRYDRDVRDAIDGIIASRAAKHSTEEDEARRLDGIRLRTEADADLENALGRLRLYSAELHVEAMPLRAVKHRSVLEHLDRDDATNQQRADALDRFLTAAQDRLGIEVQ